ncbi:glycosyl hydrolase [Christiangramia flava]|uniref:Putative alpha-L-rhamnosidase n=1 Tax=Christiangramia flava JLT2011 TaxID=1229726 RepID=A0A1L7I3G4_9FLAO|nr:glycosyl hydrolase [Christiangramia flava]APU68149.1 putative alpha-L-rhamnosidase [Christiangramia flava JLT2011]OSS41066.1 alpha-L-rhamnosidase [Christiangramia flava JLT2011]
MNIKNFPKKFIFLLHLSLFCFPNSYAQQHVSDQTSENLNLSKPWTRWWWMGNAVDKENIRTNLIALDSAGIGGVEITPIYGVKGEEANFLDHLSPGWLEIVDYTIELADSLEMGVDMVLGTGWPYGGPQVEREYAATKLVVRKYELEKGRRIKQKIIPDTTKEKQPADLLYVLAYGNEGSYKDLSSILNNDDHLNWKAKKENFVIYAVFAGKTGQKVKRAAPGGQGFTLDHYSSEALRDYIEPYDEAFKHLDNKPRAVFNDSYEVYGTDFTPQFFEEFNNRRGYDLKPFLPLLISEEKNNEKASRVRSDYRQTISELLLYNFEEDWTEWAHSKKLKTRLQAHGSPGNLIDLYAGADIPECETFGSMPFDIPGLRREANNIREGDADPVMLKFSSSAAHISGKPLTSSESFTWLRDHFKTALSQTKPETEELLLNGINHIFFHGTTYSPERAKWPGWKFYASVNFSPVNTIWEDAPAMLSFLTNCQTLLQSGKPDNELLLYWPIFDVWDDYLDGSLFFQFKIHSLNEWLYGRDFYTTATDLMKKGYSLDFISDDFIKKATVKNGKIQLPGGSYKSIVVPDSDKMPLETIQKLLQLKKEGGSIIFKGIPESIPGLFQFESKNKELKQLISSNQNLTRPDTDIVSTLKKINIYPETLVETGLKFIRRKKDGQTIYFVVNHTLKAFDGYLPLNVNSEVVAIFNPETGEKGLAELQELKNGISVRAKILPGESIFLITDPAEDLVEWPYYETLAIKYEIDNSWNIEFLKGGPELPENSRMDEPESWVELSETAEAFSGTAAYTSKFEKPNSNADAWILELGDVRESAKVWINEKFIGTAWSNPFQLRIDELKPGENSIRVEVTNLAANRIRNLEQRGKEWKIFYEINMVDKDYKKFDATKWSPTPSGLLGPVTLTPLIKQN